MYLSRLKLHGFKSFADETVLEFAPGITAIVGPNGCGKSNIVDAVRWVIGEQRPTVLRSDKMENVIFNGTANRRPLGLSEVQLTIENTKGILPTEYTEVTLGRRLYRSGESEYLINHTTSRLKDIRRLFMDTGMGADAYSVIELKMIDEILSENADERRHLFEEAAGITKYKRRRRQALRKLETTQADLARVRDRTDEVSKQVRRLERQAEKAQQYQQHDDRLRRLELALAQCEYDRLLHKQQGLQDELQTIETQIEEHTTQLSVAESKQEALRKQLVDREQTLSARQETLNEHLGEVRELETERRLEEERLEAARRDRQRTRREQEQAASRREELDATAERLESELAEAEPVLEQAEEALEGAKKERDCVQAAADEKQRALQTLRRREEQAGEKREEQRRQLDRLTNRLDLLSEDQERLEQQADELSDQAGNLKARRQQADDEREAARAGVEDARAALEQAEQERDQRQEALDEATEQQRQLERQRDAIAAEADLLESLMSSYEEFSDAVQFLAEAPDWSADGLQTVADVLGCDEEHRLALDAALGALASCIVVDTKDEMQDALRLLRDNEQGQATFLVMERLRDAHVAPAENGASQQLRPLVRAAAPAYRSLADLLLRECFVAASLEEAQHQAAEVNGPARFFTASGEWVDADGLLHGGSQRAGASPVADRFGRREQLEAAREKQAQLDEALAEQRNAVHAARDALEAVPIAARREALSEAERALRETENASERLAYEQESVERQHAQVQERLAGIQREREEGRAEVETLEAAASEASEQLEALRAQRAEAEEAFQEAEATSRAAVSQHSDAHVDAVEARNRRDNLRRELERTRQTLNEVQTRAEERTAHLEALREQISASKNKQADLDDQLEQRHRERGDLEKAVNQAKTALMETKSDISTLEKQLRQRRREREKAVEQENVRNVRLAEVETRLGDLLDDIREDYDRALDEEPVELDDDFDEAAAREDVQNLRKKIQSLGTVNPLALEEYEEEKDRLEFLTAQQEDLEEAEDTLLETISEINATAARRFEETYEAIQGHFSQLFADLFGRGAKADLELEEPDNLLESPIEINAKPRGKRPASIAQLSSGEKALTAIALLFAIYLVKPSPFCILDEVDAPLDDMNVERFMQLIRSFAEDTQFILVTHNKHTMEAADRLYGITMQEQGVSKLVGVQFEEAVEMVE